jgi:fatty-acyl-CoA synthase
VALLIEARTSGPVAPRLTPSSVGDLLRSVAHAAPDQRALREDLTASSAPRSWTYAELLRDAEHCARRLLAEFDVGDHIAIWCDNRPEWIILQFGIALAGMTLVTVNPAFKADEARYVLNQSKSVACFAAREYRGQSPVRTAREFQTGLADLRVVYDLDDWSTYIAGEVRDGDLPEVRPDAPVMIQYTSGTTGFPKGALLVHQRIVADAIHVTLRGRFGDAGVWLSPLPLFHAGGCVLAVIGALACRAMLIPMKAWSPEGAVRILHAERVEVLSAVPTMLHGLMECDRLRDHDVSALKKILAGGSQVSAELVRLVERETAAEVFIIFGQTECGPVATMTHPEDSPDDKQNTVGTPLSGFEVKIVDPETGATLRPGQLGEFVARGNTMDHYFDNVQANRAAFDIEGWLHTGDLCSMDERGYLRVEGRLKDMIIRGGENIYPREIEEQLELLPEIAEAAVVGLPDDHWGEVVAAFLVWTGAAPPDPTQLSEHLRGRLARFKVPQHWIVVPELPRTATGKIQKFQLREQWQSGAHREI